MRSPAASMTMSPGTSWRRVELLAMAAATDGDRRRHALRQRRQRAFGLGLLPVADQGVDDHDAENHAGIDRLHRVRQ